MEAKSGKLIICHEARFKLSISKSMSNSKPKIFRSANFVLKLSIPKADFDQFVSMNSENFFDCKLLCAFPNGFEVLDKLAKP